MNKTQRIELAKELFSQGYACSQSVFTAFSDIFGIDKNTALKISAGLGGGVGRMREVCGVVTAASMVLGEDYMPNGDEKSEKAKTYKKVREFSDKFKEKENTIICKELLGRFSEEKSHIPQDRTEKYYSTRPCMRLVEEGAEILCDMLKIE